ncbi:MAG: leucine-rich repeat domain-containing protein, partial [Gemmatimonadetes bacterium]|nr:leucine-rich repeat domain-containing protein [Gemmatimonadota bacterium]
MKGTPTNTAGTPLLNRKRRPMDQFGPRVGRAVRSVVAVLAAFMLAACGGGDANPTTPLPPAPATLVVTTSALPNGDLGVAYSETLTASGGDGNYTWSLTVGALPTGLSLSTSTGEISGTPMGSSSTFTIRVGSGDGQTATRQLTITINVPTVLQPSELCSDNLVSDIPTFEDVNLEAAVRIALGVGTQADLTCGLISGLTDLGANSRGIVSLVGIQNLTSLRVLQLDHNSISDISSLSGLTRLVSLLLFHNSITDISAVSGLTSLVTLSLSFNSITDISAVSGLTSLRFLILGTNSITDISAVRGLTSLRVLQLEANSISDVSSLSGLTSLVSLLLFNN